MKHTMPAVDLAGMASSARSCAVAAAMGAPGVPPINRLIDDKRNNGFTGTTSGAPARRQWSFTT